MSTKDRSAALLCGIARRLCTHAVLVAGCLAATAVARGAADDIATVDCEVGTPGGRLVIAQRAEPKTLMPVFAVDAPSRQVIRLMTADLIHINRRSLKTEPALAKSWTVSEGGRRYTLFLRRGLRFSDGIPMSADDVVFSFGIYLDETLHSPQRDLLLVDGKPITVTKKDPFTVQVDLPKPYAAAERLFDSVAILPRHLLEKAREEGRLSQAWSLSTDPAQIAGMGPFRLKKYVPGDSISLERNPYYWKADRSGGRLPYLEEVVFEVVGSEDAQVIRFQSGETDVISRIGADDFAVLAKQERTRGYRLDDLGPGLEYDFLFFNLNDLGGRDLERIAQKQTWFKLDAFRQAVSAAIDRDAIVKLVFQERAAPLWGHVTPGDKRWLNTSIPQPARSLTKARDLLSSAGFHWKKDGTLVDSSGQAVEFTVATSAGNEPRMRMATMVQADLKELGIRVDIAALEFRSLLDRVLRTFDYEACILALSSGDADPNSEMNVLVSSGGTHLWHPNQSKPATPWEAEIDQLMNRQLFTVNYQERKRLYDRVQQLMAERLPLIYLASPDILVGAKKNLGNFRPAILDDCVLWNVEELYWRSGQTDTGR